MNPAPAPKRLRAAALFTTLAALPGLAAGEPATDAAQSPWSGSDASSWRDSGWVEFGPGMVNSAGATLTTYSPGGGISTYAGDLSFETGFSARVGFREEITPWVAAEVTGGFFYNDLDHLGSGWSPNATLLQTPFMFNVVVQVPKFGRVVPFIGAGLGGTLSWLDIDDRLPVGSTSTVAVDQSSTEATFSYQGFAGVSYRLGSTALSLTYRATATGSPRWTLRDSATGDDLGRLSAEDLVAHSINLGFHVAF